LETVRSEERRRQREREAATIRNLDSDDTPAAWDQIAPHLDTALAQLGEADRDAILLRYFERKTAKEIGERLGLTAEAAQKRATRALDRLRMIFAERGLAAPTAGLANLLSVQAIQSAPVGLAASVIAAAGTAETITTATSTIGFIMASTKIKIGLAAALVAAFSIPLVIQHQTNTRLLGEIAALRQQGTELARLRDESRLTAEAQPLAGQREKSARNCRCGSWLPPKRETKTPSAAKSTRAGKLARKRIHRRQRRESWSWGRVEKRWISGPFVNRANAGVGQTNGDTNVIANALAWADENSSWRGCDLCRSPGIGRASDGSADEYVLSLFNHSGPLDDRHTLLYMHPRRERGEDEAILQLEYHYADGSTPTSLKGMSASAMNGGRPWTSTHHRKAR
jgi:hypothetical protein